MGTKDDEITEIVAKQPVVRRLVHHPESGALFEIKTDIEWESCHEHGCDDVTGLEVFENEFREKQVLALHEALVDSNVTPLELAREFTVSLSTARRWLNGTSSPHIYMHRFVYDFLKKRIELRLN